MTEEALKLALEAFENIKNDPFKFDLKDDINKAITTIKEALANEALEKMAENARELGLDYEPEQTEQEPVVFWDGESRFVSQKTKEWDKRTGGTLGFGCDIALYTTPPQRKPLTDEEAQQTFAKHNCTISTHLAGILARAIEAKLKEKNT
jgi:signal recognition particle subunit SEC65